MEGGSCQKDAVLGVVDVAEGLGELGLRVLHLVALVDHDILPVVLGQLRFVS